MGRRDKGKMASGLAAPWGNAGSPFCRGVAAPFPHLGSVALLCEMGTVVASLQGCVL